MAQGGGATCSHAHDCAEHTCGEEWSLFRHVDTPNVRALNEAVEESAQKIIRSWDDRLNFSYCLESNDDDPELIVFVPFTCDVKIRSFSVVGGTDGTSPSQMRAFINREDIDFSNVNDITAVQEWDLTENLNGELEYQTRFPRFQGVANVTLHFPSCFVGETTRIHFLGFKGEATKMIRSAVANIVYEAMPNPQDHKVSEDIGVQQIL